jgi:anaerobic magnesium-protoporphyrin IX monomethyl ester cyclase
MADCLIVGFNDLDFTSHEERVRRMGTAAGAYQDLNLSYVRHEGMPLRALDVINRFRTPAGETLHNADFLWPVILVLGSSLHRRGQSFDFINLPHLESAAFGKKLDDPTLKSVALTSTLYTEPQPLMELVAFVRARRPTVPIVIGGPYIAGQNKILGRDEFAEQLIYLGADIYVISAEGEYALGEIVAAIKVGAPLDLIDNLAFRRAETIVFTKCSRENNALAHNRVDYSLFPRTAYGEFITTRTAKSCPFSCAFCGFPERAGDYTYLAVQDVEKEFDAIAAIGGITTVTIIDDTFNVPKKRFKEILRMMIGRKYGFRWNSFFRSDHADEETIDLMAEAGCEGVILGVESGSNKILGLMNKTARREHYLQTIPRLEAAGIDCYASLIVGFPGETEETVQESIDLIETARPSYFRAQLWYCDPITPIYRQRDAHGLRGEGFHWSHRTMNVEDACGLINRMFLCVNNSIWQPQSGFEFWSTFYLQRKGMSSAQVRRFLFAFNGAIKEKLLRPRDGLAELSARRASELARLSDFPIPEAGLLEPEPLTGAAYLAAEHYWTDCLADLATEKRRDLTPLTERVFSTSYVGERPAEPDTLVAALVVAGAGLQDGWRTLLLAQDGPNPDLLPLYIPADPSMRYDQLMALTARARAAAESHRIFCLPMFHQQLGLKMRQLRRAALSAAFVEGETAWRHFSLGYPKLSEEIGIILQRDRNGCLRLRTRFGAVTTDKLAKIMQALLWDDTHLLRRIGQIARELPAISAEATFNFG